MKKPLESTCPVCNTDDTELFLQRSSVPVHQNLLCDSPTDAQRLARGELQMRICRGCGFVYNAAFDASLLEYGRQYDNTQTHSAMFQGYVGELVERIVARPEVRRGSIVEVGCGKGGFLRQLVATAGSECQGHGFDPAYEGDEVDLAGRVRFHRCFYGPEQAAQAADVVISRHVIEHIPRPMTILQSVRQALIHSPRARVYFETPCVHWILKNQVIWDFFYEHCSLFTAESLATAFQRAGFRVESVDHVFGDQYLWLEAVLDDQPSAVSSNPTTSIAELVELARQFTIGEAQWIDHWTGCVERHASEGEVVIWGGGAKGVTFANLVDRDRRWISAVVDVNPNKQGHLLPGTAHPIIAPESLVGRSVKTALLLNPNYEHEVRDQLRSLGLQVSLMVP